jgi:phage gp46-like protein
MIASDSMIVVLDGQQTTLALAADNALLRALVISLFTWRRANADDDLPTPDMRMGWWGDSVPTEPNDRIGSRLWLLSRAKMLPDIEIRAREYAEEALAWLVDDGVAARVDVEAERQGQDRLALGVTIYKVGAAAPIDVRFSNVWGFLNVV